MSVCQNCRTPYDSSGGRECPNCWRKSVVPLGIIQGGKDAPDERGLEKILRVALEESGQYQFGIIAMCDAEGRVRIMRTQPMTPFIGFGLLKLVEMHIAGEVVRNLSPEKKT